MSFLLGARAELLGCGHNYWEPTRLDDSFVDFLANVNKTLPFKCHVETAVPQTRSTQGPSRTTTSRQVLWTTQLPIQPSHHPTTQILSTTQLLSTAIAADVHRCTRIITTKYVSGNINAKLKPTTTMTSTMVMTMAMAMAGLRFQDGLIFCI